MRYVEAGGVRVSSIGLGCWQFGSTRLGLRQGATATRTAVELVHWALDHDVNLIDTAEVYARGASEAIVGRALEGRRDEAFLATKVLPIWPTADRVEEHGRLSSMRLGVATIDLYQVHWPNPLVPISSTMEGMRRLQESGHRPPRRGEQLLGAAGGPRPSARSAARCCRTRCSSTCCSASPTGRTCRTRRRNDRIVIAYSPLAQGVLGGRYDAAHPPPGPARLNNPLCLPENLERAGALIDALRRVAARATTRRRRRSRSRG